MGTEIERKFLVASDGWGPADDGALQRQGYIAITSQGNMRVRLEGDEATLTLKSNQKGLTRKEFTYVIPFEEGEQILDSLCPFVVEKTRYKREFGGHLWEIDVFHGANDGLICAEVELESEEQHVALPAWVGEEVSHDVRYRVAYLAEHPFDGWAP
jgi:CYTH domain-containing protein